jgi:hypothetical protein
MLHSKRLDENIFVNITWIVSQLIFCIKYKEALAPVVLLPFKGKNAFIRIQIGSRSSQLQVMRTSFGSRGWYLYFLSASID